MNSLDPQLENLLINIHSSILTLQAIILAPDMSDNEKETLYGLAVAQLENNRAYQRCLISNNPDSQNTQSL